MSKKSNYDEWYIQYKRLVYLTALDYLQNKEYAEDIMQDTFATLYEHIDTMEFTNIASWLITTCKHKALNENRRHQNECVEDDMEDPDVNVPLVSEVELNYIDEEARAARLNFCNEIFDAMHQKNSRWHEAMTQCYRMGIPREHVADNMGVTVGVLDSLLHRSKEWAKKKYSVTFKETYRD